MQNVLCGKMQPSVPPLSLSPLSLVYLRYNLWGFPLWMVSPSTIWLWSMFGSVFLSFLYWTWWKAQSLRCKGQCQIKKTEKKEEERKPKKGLMIINGGTNQWEKIYPISRSHQRCSWTLLNHSDHWKIIMILSKVKLC